MLHSFITLNQLHSTLFYFALVRRQGAFPGCKLSFAWFNLLILVAMPPQMDSVLLIFFSSCNFLTSREYFLRWNADSDWDLGRLCPPSCPRSSVWPGKVCVHIFYKTGGQCILCRLFWSIHSLGSYKTLVHIHPSPEFFWPIHPFLVSTFFQQGLPWGFTTPLCALRDFSIAHCDLRLILWIFLVLSFSFILLYDQILSYWNVYHHFLTTPTPDAHRLRPFWNQFRGSLTLLWPSAKLFVCPSWNQTQ